MPAFVYKTERDRWEHLERSAEQLRQALNGEQSETSEEPGRLDERVDELHRLLGIGEPRCRPAETVPETKARLDRLKRNLGT